MRINNNIAALQSQTSLMRTNRKAGLAMQKMSSGLRINNVADDAAGLAIANKLRTQVSGLHMAERNSLDGVSLVQTAEGGLNAMQEILQRMRELAVQSANDTNEPDDRMKMQTEIDELAAELNNMVDRTEFNGQKILNGTLSTLGLSKQNGVAANGLASGVSTTEGMTPGVLNYTIDQLATPASAMGTISASSTFTDSSFSINGQQVNILASDTPEMVLDKIRQSAMLSDIEVFAPNFPSSGPLQLSSKEGGSHKSITLTPAGSNALLALGLSDGTTNGTDAAIGNISYVDKSGAPVLGYENMNVVAKGNTLTFSGPSKEEIVLDLQTRTLADGSLALNDGTAILPNGQPTTGSITGMTYEVTDVGPMKLAIGPNKDMEMNIGIPNMNAHALGVSDLNYKTQESAQEAISRTESAISMVSTVRSKLGAYQNRLEHTIESLGTTSLNMEQARSRIEDADMAMEMTNYTQLNIISQAGISILAQANQRPQQILQLMK